VEEALFLSERGTLTAQAHASNEIQRRYAAEGDALAAERAAANVESALLGQYVYKLYSSKPPTPTESGDLERP